MGKHKEPCCSRCVTMAATVMIIMMTAMALLVATTTMMVSGASMPQVIGTKEEDDWMGGSTHCGVAQQQGRRSHQEDRVICMPELLLPGPGGCSDHGLHVGLFGVFDGHNGAEASEFASMQLPHLLRHHTWSIVRFESNQGPNAVCLDSSHVGSEPKDLSFCSFYEAMQGHSSITDEKRIDEKCKQMQFSVPLYRAILKEALSRALSDIDSALNNKSGKWGWQSGSTAVVVLKVDNHLLVANIGDSKAFVCSSFTEADPVKGGARVTTVKELTVDHHPDRVDERSRIEAAGGFVSTWGGVARVNGQLAISRAIGDATFKKYGVIAEPEYFEWHEFTSADSFLIITSDGIFERMLPQDVCNLVQEKYRGFNNSSLRNKSAGATVDYKALANTVVKAAYKSGSYDNLAAVVYPLNSSGAVASISKPTETSRIYHSSDREVADMLASQESSSCYELIEKVPSGIVLPLETSAGLVSRVSAGMVMGGKTEIKGSLEYLYGHSTGSPRKLEVYHEHLICLRRPVLSDEDEVCLNPETFSTYLGLIEAVPVLKRSFSNKNISDKVNSMDTNAFYPYTSIHKRYVLTENIGRGGFGEVWFAISKNCSNAENTDKALHLKNVYNVPGKSHHLKSEDLEHMLTKSLTISTKTSPDLLQDLFVLKRILVEKGNEVYLSGVRERHFGELFLNARKRTIHIHEKRKEVEDGLSHIARYVESFEGNIEGNLWLVFINEGYPLSSMIYTADTTIEKDQGHVRVLEPSNWWKWLKTTKDGLKEMRSLLHQLLLGVKACHDRNITHRDIKPENMMVRARSRCSVSGEGHEEFPCNLSMRIIDFGSAVDAYSLRNLYGPLGPSRSEQTEEYTPPESFLQRNWVKVYGKDSTKYDLWSIGVVMLELVLGTPHVFQIAARTRALLDQHLEGWGSSALNTAYMLRALMEMCILYPGKSGHHRPAANMDNMNLASWTCTEENLMLQIKERDPLGIGLEDVWALRLLRGLLQWHPEDRITVEEALRHPYFHSSIQGKDDKT